MSRIVNNRPVHVRVEYCHDEKFYKAWGKAHGHCQCCGYSGSAFGRTLTSHHIIKPGRSHEACNLLRLCQRCHSLAELLQVRGKDKEVMPKLTIGVCLAIKLTREPEAFDAARLEVLLGQKLPEVGVIPEIFEKEYGEAKPAPFRPVLRQCRKCGCTDEDCRQCIAKTGEPCSWVEADLCSACYVQPVLEAAEGASTVASTPPKKTAAPKVVATREDKRCPRCVRKGNFNPRRDCAACKERGAL